MDPPEDSTKWPAATRGYKAFRSERKPETLLFRISQKQEDNPLATYEGGTLAGKFAKACVTTLLDAPETLSPLTFKMIGSDPKEEDEPLAWERASEDWNTGEQEENDNQTEDSDLEVVDDLEVMRTGMVLTQVKEEPMEEAEGRSMGSSATSNNTPKGH